MKPPQAWQAALGQLQLQMPKATFDTWVRDVEFVAFEDDIFTIGTHNAYARDWLADRLSSTIGKLLTGIMNQAVEVRFVVVDPQVEVDIEEDDEIAEVEAVFDLPYDEIVGTGIIAIPAYFGRYHLSELGPNLAWMVVGFRQAAYSIGRRSGVRSQRISERTIASWSGINRRTFRRRKKKAKTWEKLSGFISLSSTKAAWVSEVGQPPAMAAHVYRVQMTIPLTASHACSLRHWLLNHLEQAGGPEAVLQLATQTPLEELLLNEVEEPVDAIPITVMHLVLELFDGQLAEAQLKALTQRLHHRIMPPNDQIIITHFFVENLLPLLGPGPAWMLSLLRDRCYLNRETGEYRNRVTVQGGWSEIAGWMGLKRPMTVWRWLHESRKKEQASKEPLLSAYVRELENNKQSNGFNNGSRTFEVTQDEIPLGILGQVAEQAQQSQNWSEALEAVFAQMSPTHPRTHSRNCPLWIRANVPYEIAQMSPDSRADVPYAFAQMSPNSRANAPYLSSLTPGLKHQNTNPHNLPTRDSNGENHQAARGQVGKGGDSDFSWDWEFIFKYNPEINPQDQDILRECDVTVFVAWLIYAFSKNGKGIDSPVMFALRRVQQGHAEPAEVNMYRNYNIFDLHSFLTHYPTGGHWDDMLPKTAEKRAELKRRLYGSNS
jgi:hypothetical protein